MSIFVVFLRNKVHSCIRREGSKVPTSKTKGACRMDNASIVAIAKGIKSAVVSKASDGLEAGTYNIDTLVRVKGTVTKGADFDQVQHMKVDQWGLIAVLLSKVNGVTIDAVVNEINGVDPDRITEIKNAAQEAMDKVKAPAAARTAGKVTTKLGFEVVHSHN